MALMKLEKLYPQIANKIGANSIIGFTVYTNQDEKIGTVKDILGDEDTGKYHIFRQKIYISIT